MFYLTCITITSVDLAHYGLSHAKDWVSVDCVTRYFTFMLLIVDPRDIRAECSTVESWLLISKPDIQVVFC